METTSMPSDVAASYKGVYGNVKNGDAKFRQKARKDKVAMVKSTDALGRASRDSLQMRHVQQFTVQQSFRKEVT
eukprot:6199406-Pleurochrysis_carterae.AAC.2